MSETGLSTVKNNLAPSLNTKDGQDIVNHITGEMYTVGGKNRVPDSRVVQSLANTKHLETTVVDGYQNEKEAKIIMQCTDGNSVSQTMVIHVFSTVMQDKIVSMVKKELEKKKEKEAFKNAKPYKSYWFNDLDNPFVVDENGSAIPNLTIQGQLKLVSDMTRFKTFAIRDAESKASKRVQMKILNQEWRDPEEIRSEDDKVSKVNNDRSVNKESVKPKSEPKKVKKTIKKFKRDIEESNKELKNDLEKESQEAEFTKKESKTEEPQIKDVTPPETELTIEQEQTISKNKIGNEAINRLIGKDKTIGKDNLIDEVRDMLGEKVISPAEAGKAQKLIKNA